MLDPVFKAKWTAALESGEYSQVSSSLCRNGGYCCLGVACKVAGAEFKHPPDGSTFMIAYRGPEIISDEDTVLDPSFRQEIGLSEEEQKKLYQMNDGHHVEGASDYVRKHTFAEIAAYIRENL